MSTPTNQGNKFLEHLIKHQKIYFTILLITLLSTPYLIRHLNQNPLIIGAPSYFHLNQAENLNQNNFYHNPYHLLLSLNLTQQHQIYKFFPLAFAISSLFLLIYLLKEFKLPPQKQFFFLLFLILSPTFTYTFTIFNHHSFFIFLNLLGFTLLFQKKKAFNYLSAIPFAIVPFFDLFSSLLTLSLLALYFYLKKDQKVKLLALVLTLLASTLFFLKKYLANLSLNQILLPGPYVPKNLFLNFFSDLGSHFGFSLFLLLLAFLGFIFDWKKRKTHLSYPFIIIFASVSFYQPTLLTYLIFPLTLFAAIGFTKLLEKKWNLDIIKNLSLFLLILGLIFSTLSTLSNLQNLPPDPETQQSLFWLRDEIHIYKTVFSHPQDSYLVEYFSRKPTFSHYHDSNPKTKSELTQQVFHSTYIKDTFPILEQHNISHIYLSAKTKENLPPDEGLLFLFQNERFKRLYSQDNIEIWQFR